jgi:hypothetical protein
VEEQNRDGRHVCACGCGKPIRVLHQHHAFSGALGLIQSRPIPRSTAWASQ